MRSIYISLLSVICLFIGLIIGVSFTIYYAYKAKGRDLDIWTILYMALRLMHKFFAGGER